MLRDLVSSGFRSALRGGRRRRARQEPFWALREVSFEVTEGEVLGIIGRNGAGKSTLLKILSRVTEPTEGSAQIRGRVGALLEVGTGFHPELTGRENIFLNGAVIGLRRQEIKRKFDEIVEFAGIDRFLDTPVKRYSSGMQTRLGFAVAAHLEPDVLIVDEVLAVGDAEFQRKCLGKMGAFAEGGRTVLFVSHNMNAVNRLCDRCILLDEGHVHAEGRPDEVISEYLHTMETYEGSRLWSGDDAPGNHVFRLRGLRILDENERTTATIDITKRSAVELELEIGEPVKNLRLALRFVRSDGGIAFTTADLNASRELFSERPAGNFIERCWLPADLLNSGQYSVTVSADIPFVEIIFFVESAISFEAGDSGSHGGMLNEHWPGAVQPKLAWEVRKR